MRCPSTKLLAVAAALVVTLAGCTADPPEDPTSSDAGTTASTTEATTEAPGPPSPEDVVARVEVDASPGTLAVDVLPLVRVDGGLVLTLDLTVADGEVGNVATALSEASSSASIAVSERWLGIRVLDTTEDLVAPVGLDESGEPIVSSPPLPGRLDSGRVQLYFGDPGGDELAVLIPQSGLVTGVPVLDGDVPPVPDEQDALPLSSAATAAVYPMTGYTYDLLSTTRTTTEPESLTISLGADVLFDVDSADLTVAALAVIEEAAADLSLREPGTVQVIGHTDDRRDEAYNQDLSERRAEAVAAVLETLVDGTSYPLAVSGRGETDPVASNSSAEGRAANRRVELVLETSQLKQETATQELGDATGPVATGAEGVVVEQSRPYRITAPRAWVVDGHLVVEITTTALDDATGSVFGPSLYEGNLPGWLTTTERLRTMGGVAVLLGNDATFPVAHEWGGSEGTMFPLTDLSTVNRLDGGDSRTSVLVYPTLSVGEVIAIQLVDTANPESSWRLTDIPVQDAP